MTLAELTRALDVYDRYDYTDPEDGTMDVVDFGPTCEWDPPEHIRVDVSKLPKLQWKTIKGILAHGRDVDNITRVTGYFSRTASWNAGKLAELKDRHREGV